MLPKILVIQFRTNETFRSQECVCLRRGTEELIELDFISAFDKGINWDESEALLTSYKGVILGGSGDLDFDGNRPEGDEVRQTSRTLSLQLRPFFQYLFDNDLPTLAICYGHQMLGVFAGAEVRCDVTQKKTKSHELKLLVDKSDYFLFTDLPDSFLAFYGHKDVLDRVPEGAELLCDGGEMCRVPALRYKTNIYSVQFHPELTYIDIAKRAKNIAGYLPAGTTLEEVFKDESHSNTILRNFAKMVAR